MKTISEWMDTLAKKAADDYAAEVMPNYSNGDYDCIAIAEAFEHGAQWRINSVWHDDISECKDIKRWIVVEYNNGYVDVLPDIRDLDRVKDLVVRVAYVTDLLPERKERKG